MKPLIAALVIGCLLGAACYQTDTDPRPKVHQVVQEVRQRVSDDR